MPRMGPPGWTPVLAINPSLEPPDLPLGAIPFLVHVPEWGSDTQAWAWLLVPDVWQRTIEDVRYVLGTAGTVAAVVTILNGMARTGLSRDAWGLLLQSAPWRIWAMDQLVPEHHPVRHTLDAFIDVESIRDRRTYP